MNMQELKADAERRSKLQAIPLDHAILSDFAAALLSDAPVTAEWLREKWGWQVFADGRAAVNDLDLPGFDGNFLRMEFWVDASYLMLGNDIDDESINMAVSPTQGQFTMLALGLGLKPVVSL